MKKIQKKQIKKTKKGRGKTKEAIPIIDLSPLISKKKNKKKVKEVSMLIGKACKEYGFFYIKNHGIDMSIVKNLED